MYIYIFKAQEENSAQVKYRTDGKNWKFLGHHYIHWMYIKTCYSARDCICWTHSCFYLYWHTFHTKTKETTFRQSIIFNLNYLSLSFQQKDYLLENFIEIGLKKDMYQRWHFTRCCFLLQLPYSWPRLLNRYFSEKKKKLLIDLQILCQVRNGWSKSILLH